MHSCKIWSFFFSLQLVKIVFECECRKPRGIKLHSDSLPRGSESSCNAWVWCGKVLVHLSIVTSLREKPHLPTFRKHTQSIAGRRGNKNNSSKIWVVKKCRAKDPSKFYKFAFDGCRRWAEDISHRHYHKNEIPFLARTRIQCVPPSSFVFPRFSPDSLLFLQPCPRCGSREDVWCVKRGSLPQARAHKSSSFSSPVLGIAAPSTAEEKCEIKINIIKCREGCGSGARAGKAAWETEPWPRVEDNPRFLLWWCVSSQQMTRVLSKHSPVQLAQRESERESLGSDRANSAPSVIFIIKQQESVITA